MESDAVRTIDRRRLLRWGGLAAAGVAAGAPLTSAGIGHADPTPTGSSRHDQVPMDTLPGRAYDRYVAQVAAQGAFSGVVLLSHQGRTVLSRAYGMADRQKGIRNGEGTAFSLSSAGKPFHAVAVLQLAQQGKLQLSDTVGTHLTGFATDVADQVTIHHLLSGTSGTAIPAPDVQRIFQSQDEVHEYYAQWARQSTLVSPVGTPDNHVGADAAIPPLIVEAVTGMTYWDYVQDNIFDRCGMTGSGFYTRPRWLSDAHIAHPYMTLADGTQVDALTNLDKGSPLPEILGKNPARAFIDAPGDGGFVTAPDLVRFAHGLADGTLLNGPWTDVLTAAKLPQGAPGSFGAYLCPISIVGSQWMYERAGGNPGVAANWDIYPDTGWVGIILGNIDAVPLVEMIGQEMQAITGIPAGTGTGG